MPLEEIIQIIMISIGFHESFAFFHVNIYVINIPS